MLRTAIIAAAMLLSSAALAGNGYITGNSDDWSVTEDWSDYSTGVCQFDTFVFGTWQAGYDGGGCTQVYHGSSNYLQLSPSPIGGGVGTHGALVFSTFQQGGANYGSGVVGDIYINVPLKTIQQFRTPTPNVWEVGWVWWNVVWNPACSAYNFNYFTPKTNGWEYGRGECAGTFYHQDVVYSGNTNVAGGSAVFPINTYYDVEIYQTNGGSGAGNIVDAYVNGTHIMHYTGGTVFTSGGFAGLYTEDAQVNFYQGINGTRW
jgi:hypothetical protein